MLNKENKLVITFHTSSMAFATEKACKIEKLVGMLISAPRKLSADCGISYSTDTKNKPQLLSILEKYKIEYDRMVEL